MIAVMMVVFVRLFALCAIVKLSCVELTGCRNRVCETGLETKIPRLFRDSCCRFLVGSRQVVVVSCSQFGHLLAASSGSIRWRLLSRFFFCFACEGGRWRSQCSFITTTSATSPLVDFQRKRENRRLRSKGKCQSTARTHAHTHTHSQQHRVG